MMARSPGFNLDYSSFVFVGIGKSLGVLAEKEMLAEPDSADRANGGLPGEYPCPRRGPSSVANAGQESALAFEYKVWKEAIDHYREQSI